MEFYPSLFAAVHFMLLLFPSASLAVHNNHTDLSALLAFKAHVSDPHNILSRNWTANTSFCAWIGVSCSRRRQRVVSLRFMDFPLYGCIVSHVANLSFLSQLILSNNSLVGSIPDSLSQLHRLKTLVLQENQLSGTIPPAIFDMSLLTELYLDDNNLSGTLPVDQNLTLSMLPQVQNLGLWGNQLSGSIPSGLSRCYHLRVLDLSENQFSGNIPLELGNLKQLRSLYLWQNNLTGTIPASLGNLTNLLALELCFNNIQGNIPEELGGLSNLNTILLNNNHGITGPIPASLGNLTNLLNLDLGFNNIHGNIPEELGGLSNLNTILLNHNHGITGPIPISLSNISSLSTLDLSYCNHIGPIHMIFGNMPRLQYLDLGMNKLIGGLDFLESLSNCEVLQTLVLSYNELDGSLPNTIGNLSRNLLQFAVGANHIKGEIPAELGNLSSLEVLDLGGNELVGIIPSKITMLENLQWLDLSQNSIYGTIPKQFGKLSMLNRLYFYGNSLSGCIPDSIGNITALEHFSMSSNALSSGIPQSMWHLTRLIELNLSQNSLSGFLSSGVGNIKFLNAFDVSMNQLSGEIPSTLKELQMLAYLDLSNNSFDGQIPPSFGELLSVQVLNLSNNNLSGVIPNSLVNLRYLSSINLSFNKLQGKVPSSGVFLNISISSLVGNEGLCGAPKLNFPTCSIVEVSNSRSKEHLLRYILPAIASIVTLVLAFCILVKLHRKRATNRALADTQSPYNYRLITYHELIRATNNFNESNLLGRGSFGSVYKGCLDDGLLTAIKVLNLDVDGASRSFDVECSALRMVRHRNLVKIITTCSNLDFRALVLQFMPNGSLERWLYSHNYCLSLLQRINIILDVASALEYLHHNHSHVVLHCDLKPSNILLDKEMTAHVSDFGIAKLLVGDSRSLTLTSTPWTIGYIAPEYASTGRVSRKTDVYSFGILLLEIFTRKMPTDPIFSGESSLRQWICEARSTTLLEVVDNNLFKDESGNDRLTENPISVHACMSSIMNLGIICSEGSPEERPTMKDVVMKLQKIKMDFLSLFPNA